MPKERIAIIGAGFSGISAALNLSGKEREFHIFEARSYIGGRAFSFYDKKSDFIFDNGQHLLMGAYRESISLFKKLKVFDKLLIDRRMKISYFTKDSGFYSFRSFPFLPAPFHLAYSLFFDFKPLSFLDRFRLVFPALSLFRTETDHLKNISIKTWLRSLAQNENTIRYVWNLIAESTMNDSIENLSAYSFKRILRILFLEHRTNANPILSKVGLSELTQDAFLQFLAENKHQISMNSVVKGLRPGKVVELKTRDKNYQFNKVILALPHYAAQKLLPENIPDFKTTSILSIHFSTDCELFKEQFVGFPEEQIHWIFNRDKITGISKHLYSATISYADRFLAKNQAELSTFFEKELQQLFPAVKNITVHKIIHEKRATFSDCIGTYEKRPAPSEIQQNVFICGDWTQTGLPATIESACLSGKMLATLIDSDSD